MKYNSFSELDSILDVLYRQERYTEALDTLAEGMNALSLEELEKNYFMLGWIKARLLSICGKYGECLDLINGIVSHGYPFPISFKRFDPLRGMEGYSEISKKNDKLLAKANEYSGIRYEVHIPDGYKKEMEYPLFIALHGHGICNIKEFSGYWKPHAFTRAGFIFVYLQSSQLLCHEGYGWMDDYEKANSDIGKCIQLIKAEYPVDDSLVFIGGFSGGAIAAVNFVMANILPVKGFIALCPEVKPKAFTKENVRLAAGRGVRGVVMEGELMLPVADEDEMMETFDEEALPYEFYMNEGIGHEAPADLDEKLKRALEFILG